MRILLLTVTALPVLLVPGSGWSQTVQTVDAGSFTISVNGQRVGREDFSIVSTPSGRGREFQANGTVVYGDRRLAPLLRADTTGTPSFYKVETRTTDAPKEIWTGTIQRGRVSATISNARGDAGKEFIVTEGALILDDDVFHQYYFIARRMASGTVAVVIPRRNAQVTLRVTSSGTDRITVGTQEIEANHLTLAEPSGAVRDLWVDRQGRVLKVAIPSRGVAAVRDDPPR